MVDGCTGLVWWDGRWVACRELLAWLLVGSGAEESGASGGVIVGCEGKKMGPGRTSKGRMHMRVLDRQWCAAAVA